VSRTTRETLFTIGYVAVGLIAVVAVGYLSHHRWFFHFPEPMLSFLILGLMGALIYASVQMRGAGYAVLVIALWCLVRAALNGDLLSLEAPAMYALPVGFALMAAAYVQKSLSRLKFGRFISMGLIVGIGYALYILVYLIMGGGGIRLGTVWNQTFLGAKLGAAMGLGFELIDLIGSRPEHEPRPGPGRW
jgi:hypothetical protein